MKCVNLLLNHQSATHKKYEPPTFEYILICSPKVKQLKKILVWHLKACGVRALQEYQA
jgi:tRNA splicing ligase